jgi:small-conductance mechanosensitive channel
MKRLLTPLLLLLTAALPGAAPVALAQPPAASAPTPAQQAPAQAGINPADAQRVIDMLNDPKKRADFTATLDTIAKSAPQPVPAGTAPAGAAPTGTAPTGAAPTGAAPAGTTPAAPALPIPLAPDSLGAQLLVSGSSVLDRVSERLRSALADLRSIPPMGGWILMMATDPLGRKLLLDTAWRLAVTFAAGLAAEAAARWLLRRPIAALGTGRRLHLRAAANGTAGDAAKRLPAPSNVAVSGDDSRLDEIQNDGQTRAELGAIEPPERRRSALLARLQLLPGILLRLLLELVPVVCFVVTAHLVVGTAIGEVYLTQLVLLAMIDAYAVSRIILSVARAVLSPDAPRWRLLPVSTETAVSGVRWVRRLTLVGVFGYAAAEAGLLLGMSPATHAALLKTDGLVLLVMAIVIVLRNRASVAALIRARPGHQGPMVRWRKRLAAVWHVLAVLYLAGLWLVWAVDVPDGFRRLLFFFVVTILVTMAARLVRSLLLGLLERQLEREEALNLRHPGLAARLRIWHPVLSLLVHVVVSIAALILLLQFWGFGAVEWLAGNLLAQRMISALTTVGVAVAFGVGVWELANAAIEQHLSRLQRDAQTARSARLRTLLPMLRTALLIAILTVLSLVVLSEIGVNIAPLLAGAGVLGIAIGFGSQKLVQDVITGLFLLLENTMQVGDVVLLGGLQGVVEHLSIRTIRLRAEDGSVHVIPFSAVTTVTNMTRDFAHAVVEVQVAYREDYDRVVEVLRRIVTQMRAEPRWQSEIRDDLEVMGVRFADGAQIIKCRIRCGPFGRWAVLREFNRRMKIRFDEEGIETPFPHQSALRPVVTAAEAAAALPPPAT